MPRKLSKPDKDAPYREEAERLERMRDRLGFATLKDFEKALEDRGHEVSYQTLRNWHRGDRQPSPDYYAALHQIFEIRLEFLLLGEGPITRADELHAPDAEVGDALSHHRREMRRDLLWNLGGPIWEAGGGTTAWMYVDLVERILDSCSDAGDVGEYDDEVVFLAGKILDFALAPYYALSDGFDTYQQQVDFLQAILHALALAVPDVGKGLSIKELLKRLSRWQRTG